MFLYLIFVVYNLNILRSKSGEQVALLKVQSDDKNPATLPSAVALSSSTPKLGQTIVYIGGESKDQVSTGIVSGLSTEISGDSTASSTASSTPSNSVSSIETNIDSESLMPGAPLVDISGNVVAIKATFMDTAKTDLFVPSQAIKDALANLAADQKATQ
jgi:hypothetical protein